MSTAEELEKKVHDLLLGDRVQEAAALCDELNRRFPDYGSGWYTTSRMASVLGDPGLALQAIDRALYLSPETPAWLLQRIECLGALGDSAQATAIAQHLSAHTFDTASHAAQFGRALTRLGLFELALPQYQRACDLEPGNSSHFFGLACVLRYLGDVGAAQDAFDNCVRLDPDDSAAYLQRSGLRKQTGDSNHIEELEMAHERARDKPMHLVRLCYALAKELEDVGQIERSFDFLLKGSALYRQGISYDASGDIDALRAVRERYGPEMFDGRVQGHVSAEPIFVIGMPQSGVTLVERILVNHPAVQYAGELKTFSRELMKHCAQVPGQAPQTVAEMVANSTSIDFAALGEDYLEATRPATGLKPHFVDKQPLNFHYAGLIHLALPKAKIILVRRDPMDNCYAAFRTLYENTCAFSYELSELADYYVIHSQFIDHWESVMPGVMHAVRYEDLVTDPRPVIEGLLEYCSLSLNESCLQFDPQRGDSIGIWRNFSEQLRPVSQILESAGLHTD